MNTKKFKKLEKTVDQFVDALSEKEKKKIETWIDLKVFKDVFIDWVEEYFDNDYQYFEMCVLIDE